MKIFVKAKPGARQERVEKINENSFSVFVKERPEKGKANLAVIKALAEFFKIPSSGVRIIKGQKSKNKIVEVRV